ncbi:RHS repeat domain-containing protein [Streptomyces sp. NPDC058145]|uniref:RHS repeat domain-containing protein n=1 Tax=Streptomyces sp. NPDC058145 TaxID=3346356 RepID=UPI0036E34AD0
MRGSTSAGRVLLVSVTLPLPHQAAVSRTVSGRPRAGRTGVHRRGPSGRRVLSGRLIQAVAPGARRSASRPPWASAVRDRQRPFHLRKLRPAGRRTHRTAPNGATSEWSYDAAGNPTRLTTAGRTIDIAYEPVGQETTRHAGAAITIMDRRPQASA